MGLILLKKNYNNYFNNNNLSLFNSNNFKFMKLLNFNFVNINFLLNFIFILCYEMGIGDWGLVIGEW